MDNIVECVPNFSEGHDRETIEALAAAVRETPGCILLDVSPGASTHRTVYTFVGEPEAVVAGALAAARVARERIDMRLHRGEHPRMGALDVCPFVPVRGVSMADCAELARNFGSRLAAELGIPVYLYEEAAEHDYRRRLEDIREGEYEGLPTRLADVRWQPDFGPAEFIPAWGATAVGARTFLLAYNVNILGTPNQAHRIALNLREAGRGEDEPGRLKRVKGMGWFVNEYNLAQVTANLTDYRVTPMHLLFEEVKKEAEALGIGVAGSELIGVLPLEAMLMTADYYIAKEGIFVYEEDQKIRLAVERLGLNAVGPFDPYQRIIEYRVAEPPVEPLASLTVRRFVEEVAARTSAPGGGSVAATVAALGAALATMVARLTYGVRKFEDVASQMRQVIPPLHRLTRQLIPLIDADAAAYDDYVEALRLPRDTPEEKKRRKRKMQEGLHRAIEIPLTTMRLADECWPLLEQVARFGNIASASDIQVGARALETGIWGAFQNVLINLKTIEDSAFCAEVLAEVKTLLEQGEACAADIQGIVEQRDGR